MSSHYEEGVLALFKSELNLVVQLFDGALTHNNSATNTSLRHIKPSFKTTLDSWVRRVSVQHPGTDYERTQTNRQKLAYNYRCGDKPKKSKILDVLVDLTGWHRDYARAALREALRGISINRTATTDEVDCSFPCLGRSIMSNGQHYRFQQWKTPALFSNWVLH